MADTPKLLPCPFCGEPASVEEIGRLNNVGFSAGCDSKDEDSCMGYQSFQTFALRSEAIAAWNKRPSPTPEAGPGREELARLINPDAWWNHDRYQNEELVAPSLQLADAILSRWPSRPADVGAVYEDLLKALEPFEQYYDDIRFNLRHQPRPNSAAIEESGERAACVTWAQFYALNDALAALRAAKARAQGAGHE